MARSAIYIIKNVPCKVVLICVSLSSDLEVKTLKKHKINGFMSIVKMTK
jgi:hypothetical protein